MSVNLQKAEFVRSAAKAGDFPRDRLPQVAFAGRSNVWARHRARPPTSTTF